MFVRVALRCSVAPGFRAGTDDSHLGRAPGRTGQRGPAAAHIGACVFRYDRGRKAIKEAYQGEAKKPVEAADPVRATLHALLLRHQTQAGS